MHRIDTLGDIDRHSANSLEPKGILEGLLKIGRSPATLAESNNFRLWEEKVVGTSGRCNRQRMHSHSAFHDLNGAVRKPHQLCGRTIFQFFPDLRGGTTIVAGRSGACCKRAACHAVWRHGSGLVRLALPKSKETANNCQQKKPSHERTRARASHWGQVKASQSTCVGLVMEPAHEQVNRMVTLRLAGNCG